MSDITLYSPSTGELLKLSVKDASDEEIAHAKAEVIPDLYRQLADAEEIANVELLARLDRSGRWTRRTDIIDGGHQYEIKASSPDAGTAEYDVDVLAEVLDELVADDVIDQTGASAALERSVVVVFKADTAEEAAAIVAQIKGADGVTKAEATPPKARVAGIKALEKIPAARDRLAAARRVRDPGPRRPTVKRIEKER